jgi:hypothetical protein
MKSSQNTWASTLNAARTASLINFTIELPDPGERKRLQIGSKPESNRNHGKPAQLELSAIKTIRYNEKPKSHFPPLFISSLKTF